MASREKRKGPDGQGTVYKNRKPRGPGTIWTAQNRALGITVYGATQQEALQKRRDRESLVAPVSSTVGSEGPRTVAELLALYVERGCPTQKRKDKAPSSAVLDRHRLMAEKLTAAYVGRRQFGGFQLAEVTLDAVEKALAYLHRAAVPSSSTMGRPTKPQGLASLEKARDTLRMAFEYARRRGWVAGNVVADASLPFTADDDDDGKERGYLPRKEANRACRVFEAEGAVLFYVLLRMGLRWAEGAALTPDSIVGDSLYVHRNIRRDVQKETVQTADGPKVRRVTRRVVTRQMKTDRSERTLALPADVRRVLRAHMKAEAARLEAEKAAGRLPLLFVGQKGGVLNDGYSRKQLARICAAHRLFVIDEDGNTMLNDDGTPRPPMPHELRHTWATLAVDAGMTAVEVADHLGHSDTRTVFDVYRKVSRNRPRTAGVERDWYA